MTRAEMRAGAVGYAALVCLVVLGASTCGVAFWVSAHARSNDQPTASPSNSQSESKADREIVAEVSKPASPPKVWTDIVDSHGQPVTVACSTCHATRLPNVENKLASDLNEFHSALELAHGNISCLSCHNPQDYDSLKLADGTAVHYPDVMRLCSQCHGKQAKEFELGVHGGMTGHWDLRFGSQSKNNCIDCHHPHMPAFPKMKPTFKPRDRFLESSEHEDEH